MDKERAKGIGKDVKGRMKEAVGAVAGDRKMKQEGRADQIEGTVRKQVGKAKERLQGDRKAVKKIDEFFHPDNPILTVRRCYRPSHSSTGPLGSGTRNQRSKMK